MAGNKPVGEHIVAEAGNDGAQARLDAVMRAVLAVSTGLELEETLQQIVHEAAALVDARYAALGVLGDGGMLAQFVYTGIDPAAVATLGPPPCGRGVLGVVIEQGQSLRLPDVTTHPAFTGFPPHHPPMRTFLGVPIKARGRIFGRLYLTEKNGGHDFTDDDQGLVEALAAAAGVAVDNARQYGHSQRGRAFLAATAEIAADLLRSNDIDQALWMIANRARELTSSDTVAIFLPADPDAALSEVTELRVAVGIGPVADHLAGTLVPVAGSTSGAVFTDLQPRNVSRLAFDPAGLGAPLGPVLAVPLVSGQWRFGVLSLARPAGATDYDQDETLLTTTFAEQAALALRGAAQQTAQRRLDVLGDRERIARDLHDEVIQRLFAIGLAMRSTQRAATVPAQAARIGQHLEELQQVVRQIRGTIFDLTPPPAPELPVQAMLNNVITDLTGPAQLHTTIRIPALVNQLPEPIPDHTRAVLREAVSNAVHHAHATHLTVTITVTDQRLSIDVADDGTGIPADITHRGGLRNLHDRATQLHGTFSTAPTSDGGGTRLRWTMPLPTG